MINMKVYAEKCVPDKIDLDYMTTQHPDYTVQFVTEYYTDDGVFTYEKNTLYKESAVDGIVEKQNIGDIILTLDNSYYKRDVVYNLPSEHLKRVVYKYVFARDHIHLVVESVRNGDKCVPIDVYFQIKDAKLLTRDETIDDINVFLSLVK